MADEEEDKRLPSFKEPPRKPRSATPGMQFGKLTVIKAVKRDGANMRECRCECGNTAIVQARNLTSGHTKSCGCRAGIKSGDPRIVQIADSIMEGTSMREASSAAGLSKTYMAKKNSGPDLIRAEVAQRQAEARARAPVHTDTIVGSLVEIMSASPADVLPDHPILAKAKANGTAHLIKKITIVPVRVGTRERKNKNGSITTSPVIRERIDLEMYSRLDAIGQLCNVFGMKSEPRANSFEETKRQEIEREIQNIMVAEKCDEEKAARMLRDELGSDVPHLTMVIDKILKKLKTRTKAELESVH